MSEQEQGLAGAIDIHAHWYPEGCLSEATRNRPDFEVVVAPDGRQALLWRGSQVISVPPAGGDLAARLALMDAAGVRLEVLSLGALDVEWAGSRAAAVARWANDALAELCRQTPGRFRFVAALPTDPRADMVRELDRALGLGAVGVGITTTMGGRPLDAPELRAFWRAASELRLIVLVHPTYPPNGPAGDGIGQFQATGYPGETGLVATRLVLAGVLEECPNVRLVWSHLGGSLPMVVERIDRRYRPGGKLRRPPSAYLRDCFYDTACGHGPAFDCAHATFGAGALLFGTDEPHVPNATRDVHAAIRARPWPAAEAEAVLAGNARRLLGEL